MSLTMGWVGYLVGEIAGLATVVGKEAETERTQDVTVAAWTRAPRACEGARIVGDGFDITVGAHGHLDVWDEARLVHAWAMGRGNRSGRTAFHFILDLAARLDVDLTDATRKAGGA